MQTKILAFAGSTRTDSFNKKLLHRAVAIGHSLGATINLIDLRNYPLPLYDGDLETNEGLPDNAKKLKALFLESQGLLLACPEYNSSISAVLKNTIDWVSRPDDLEYLIYFKNKLVSLMSASPGALGGLRGLQTERSIFTNIGSIVLPTQTTLANAQEKFTPDGMLTDDKKEKALQNQMKEFIETLTKLYP